MLKRAPICRQIAKLFLYDEFQQLPTHKTDEELLLEAQAELEGAENLFMRMTEPEMVDYAIFQLYAAEKRYNYLFKLIKGKHLNQKESTNREVRGIQ
ncbi:MAG: DUF2508 family protein [Syntrophomonadaceae bacterium]|nr:DUF2508 family protein [Syntrophomonadaceae bacterium]